MLKLAAQSGLFWLDLVPGVRVEVEPISIASMLIARETVTKVLGGEDQDDVEAKASVALVHEVCRRGIKRWEGVGDAEGQALPVTPENVDAFLNVWEVYDALDLLYVTPALRRSAEKNESSASPSGTSAEEPSTARPAK